MDFVLNAATSETPVSAVQQTFNGLIAAGALFLITVLILGGLSWRIQDLDYWTVHTHKVIETLKDAISSLQDVETGERGFLLNRLPEFMEPFNNGSLRALQSIEAARRLTADNPQQQQAVAELQALAETKIRIARTNTKNVESPEILSLERQGKTAMDSIRGVISRMIENEERLLKVRSSQLEGAQRLAMIVIGVFVVVSMALLSWVFNIGKRAIVDEQNRVKQLAEEIEHRKQIELALKEASINLSRSNADLQQFAYVASHDLQEPLRAIMGFLSLLKTRLGKGLDEESEMYVKHAVEGGQRMRELITALLTFARVETRGAEPKPVPLEKVLETIKLDLAVAIEEAHATIESTSLPTVTGDKTQLTQLFFNLIGNAIKFRGSEPPVVKITAERDGNDWLFSIKDNGRGFDMEHADRIFIIFQRLQSRDEAPGTGIGLALCKKIVERHNGSIWVESKLGLGTTFFFKLPADLKVIAK